MRPRSVFPLAVRVHAEMNVVGQVSPLGRHSDEFAAVEHLLQLSCRSTLVKDVAVWSVNNPHLSVQYERRAAGSLAVDVWIDINKLDELNAVQDVCKRGFHMPDNGSGMEVVTGNIRFDMEGPEVHHYLLCTVAVGRSFVLDDPSARRELAPGYDSLYMHLADNSGAMEALDGPDMYRHQYVVFDAAQLLPRYVVHFTYHPRERFLRTPVAPINLNEIKARVADALSLLGPAAPAATEKMLSDIGDAYQGAVSAAQMSDPLLEERKRTIRDSLKAIDDKLRAVQSNGAEVEEQLYQKLQDALFQLQEETQRKLNLLLSEELELRRQAQQIEWSESFVGVMQSTLPPMSFISAWERHTALRSQLYAQLANASASRVADEVQADMRLVGHLEIISERSAAVAAAASAHMAGLSASTGARAALAGPGGVPSLPQLSALPPSTRLPPAENAQTLQLWTSLLRENMGLPAAAPTTGGSSSNSGGSSGGASAGAGVSAPAPASLPPFASPSMLSGIPLLTVEQADAAVALARANLNAIDAALTTLPASLRAQGEAAHADALASLGQAEAARAALPQPRAAPHSSSGEAPVTTSAAMPKHAAPPAATVAVADASTAAAQQLQAPPPPPPTSMPPAHTHTASGSSASGNGHAQHLVHVQPGGHLPMPGARRRSILGAEDAASADVTGSGGTAIVPVPAPAPAPALALPVTTATALVPAPVPAPTPARAQPSLDDRLARYSLRKEAERAMRQRGTDAMDPAAMFVGSTILPDADARTLYMCLPLALAADPTTGGVVAVPPVAHLLWSSHTHEANMASFMNAYMEHGNFAPSVVVVKSGAHVFGGYAADAWDFSNLFMGTPASFLFSVTRDAKIPYTGRQRGPRQMNDDALRQEHEMRYQTDLMHFAELEQQMAGINGGVPPYDASGRLIVQQIDASGEAQLHFVSKPHPRPFIRCDALLSTPDSMQFGVGDLVLKGDLSACTSDVEHSYGVGLRPGSEDARTLLAGAPTFRVDAIEVWSILPSTGSAPGGGGGGDAGAVY